MTLRDNDADLVWEFVESHKARDHGLFPIIVNKLRSPRNGKVYPFYVYQSEEWVAAIPITPEEQVVMVRQFRHGTGEITLELPGGLSKEENSPLESAAEELEEETGYRSSHWSLMCIMDPLPALFSNRLHVFVAQEAEPTGQMNQDETEAVETVLVPVSEIKEYLRQGRITSCIHVAALYRFLDAGQE